MYGWVDEQCEFHVNEETINYNLLTLKKTSKENKTDSK